MLSSKREAIAITGVSARFAGAQDVRTFWKQILYKRQLFSPFATGGRTYAGGLFDRYTLPEYGAFLGEQYGCHSTDISLPDDLNLGDCADYYFISQLIYDALQDANLSPSHPSTDRIACFMGYEPVFNASTVNWLQHTAGVDQTLSILQRFFPTASIEQMNNVREALVDTLPPLHVRQIEFSHPSILLVRLAQAFGFSDTISLTNVGDASAFAALEAGVLALQENRCDVAVIGAVQPPLTETHLMGKAAILPFSEHAQIKPYSDEACGTLPGEGGAFFVLRRLTNLADSERDPYAVVHGTAVVASSHREGQEEGHVELLRRTLHRALRRLPNGFRDVDYWEMNGSGIREEDAVEEALLNRMTTNRGAHIPLLALGSVKPTIGHTMIASGAAALLKATLALHYRILPPSVTPEESFHLKQSTSAYYWVQEARPWIASSMRKRRIATSVFSQMGYAGAAVLTATSGDDR